MVTYLFAQDLGWGKNIPPKLMKSIHSDKIFEYFIFVVDSTYV